MRLSTARDPVDQLFDPRGEALLRRALSDADPGVRGAAARTLAQ